jgi:hypothetical protein
LTVEEGENSTISESSGASVVGSMVVLEQSQTSLENAWTVEEGELFQEKQQAGLNPKKKTAEAIMNSRTCTIILSVQFPLSVLGEERLVLDLQDNIWTCERYLEQRESE